MSLLKLIVQSLFYHRRLNLAVGLGVMAGTAVLTGALLVGDSVRYSLRRLTLDRLGRIDEALVADRFFGEDLAARLASTPGFADDFREALPAILISGSVSEPTRGSRAGRVTLIGCDERFWRLGDGGATNHPASGEVVLNEPLAAELGVKVGDPVVVRFQQPSEVPADSPLGRKTDTLDSRRLRVSVILPAEGLGRFGLRPNQQLPRNAYMRLETLQRALEQSKRANCILVAGEEVDNSGALNEESSLNRLLKPSLADYGLSVGEVMRGDERYIQLTSTRMLLEPAAEQAALRAFAPPSPLPADRPPPVTQSVLTYLANTIAVARRNDPQADEADGRPIPYSTVAGIDVAEETPLGPFLDTAGIKIAPLADDEIAINSWAAKELAAEPGDILAITYFEPESTHGRVLERTIELKLAAVVDLSGAALDPALTPDLPGVTDRLDIGRWDPPFPYDDTRVLDQDEAYWDEYRTTPKAFVSLATGRRLWGSRFGQTTSIRIAAREGESADDYASKLLAELEPAELGLAFQPVKRQGLASATGTTPFNLLFLGFSFFIIASAVMLVALLFRLGIERRAREVGILHAVGFRGRLVVAALAGEGLVIAALGSLAGAAAGVGYAWLMVYGLRTWWVKAISTPFLRLDVTQGSLAIGFGVGVLVALSAMLWGVWQMRRVSVRRLLADKASDEGAVLAAARARWPRIASWIGIALAAVLGLFAANLGGEAQAGAFFGAGGLVLASALIGVWTRLRSGGGGDLVSAGGWGLERLALRGGARHPGRSTLSIGLVACASFLIVALSAFQQDPSQAGPDRESGNGGFSLLAESDQSIFFDLTTPEGRREAGIDDEESQVLQRAETFAFRVQPGDDASCLNLYQVGRPRVLGVPAAFAERGGFAWSGTAAQTDEEVQNPWRLLANDLGRAEDGSPIVPVVIDQNTALYSLHLWKGVGSRLSIEADGGRMLHLEVVGLLKNSIFQGSLLIAERTFLDFFPEVGGNRYFLIATPSAETGQVERAFESALGDYGFDSRRTGDVLADFLAVQNTYLQTFQSLGGLGLLLGTFGLATVQLRNVLERRGELALLRATGFRRTLLARLVMTEHAALLLGGLAIGVLAAAVAILPHLLRGGAEIPWTMLAATLGLIVAIGLVTGLAAVRATLITPLLPALRGE